MPAQTDPLNTDSNAIKTSFYFAGGEWYANVKIPTGGSAQLGDIDDAAWTTGDGSIIALLKAIAAATGAGIAISKSDVTLKANATYTDGQSSSVDVSDARAIIFGASCSAGDVIFQVERQMQDGTWAEVTGATVTLTSGESGTIALDQPIGSTLRVAYDVTGTTTFRLDYTLES